MAEHKPGPIEKNANTVLDDGGCCLDAIRMIARHLDKLTERMDAMNVSHAVACDCNDECEACRAKE